jgi:hypothetical protein
MLFVGDTKMEKIKLLPSKRAEANGGVHQVNK